MLPLLAVIMPFVVGLGVSLLDRAPNVRDGLSFVGSVVTFGIVASMLPDVLAGNTPTSTLFEILPGVELTLRADAMGMVFAFLAAFLWMGASVYAVGYMRGENAKHQTRFFVFYAWCLSTAFGLAFSGDLLTFFIFYELLTIATYPLVTHKGDDKARAAGRTYLMFLLPGGAALLAALALAYATTGDVTFTAGGFLGDAMSPAMIWLMCALFLAAFGTKSGIMPLHPWLPAAMVAPTPVSALLHAVAVVKAGVFGFARAIGFVIGPETLSDVGANYVLATLAAITIVVASVIALRQDALKRRLAFSTIAHLSYIVLGLSLFAAEAFDGALLHIFNHGLAKITLFMVAGAIYVHRHFDKVSELNGIGRTMPWTMGAWAIASLSLAGLPPMGGLLSKWYLVAGGFAAGDYLFAAVMVVGGLLTASYLFPVFYAAFFKPAPDPAEAKKYGEASPAMVVPLCITAAAVVLMGLGDLIGIQELAASVAAAVMGGAP